jgi:hypothetical protein
LTYSLESGVNDNDSFEIVPTSGQLQTKAGVTLDHEAAKNEYTVTVGVTDDKDAAGDTDDTVDARIDVTITVTNVVETGETNSAPVFTEGATATRSIPENTASGVAIGTPVAATDADDTSLTYTLGGTNQSSFRIDSGSGQLRTQGSLNYETKSSYTVTVSVTDNKNAAGETDSTDDATITVTINVTDVSEDTGGGGQQTGGTVIVTPPPATPGTGTTNNAQTLLHLGSCKPRRVLRWTMKPPRTSIR